MFDEKEIAQEFDSATFETGDGGPITSDFEKIDKIFSDIQRKLHPSNRRPSLSEQDGDTED